jgi:hypothetical protein
MVLSRVFVVLVAVVGFPAIAVAATVSPIAGDVRIGTGHGFHRINAPTEVAAGAQIMVGPQGSASITYSDDCIVRALPEAITIVQRGTPCREFPRPAYFGFADGQEYGIGPGIDLLQFTPKVTPKAEAPEPVVAPEPVKAPAPVEASGSGGNDDNNKAAATLPAESVGQSPSSQTILVVGGVVVGAGVLALLLAGGGDSPASP